MPYWRLFYHITWGTKNRLALIEPAWESDLYGYLWGKATALECIPHAIGGMPDHVHLAISIPPKQSFAKLLLVNSKEQAPIISMKITQMAPSHGKLNMVF